MKVEVLGLISSQVFIKSVYVDNTKQLRFVGVHLFPLGPAVHCTIFVRWRGGGKKIGTKKCIKIDFINENFRSKYIKYFILRKYE